MDPNQRPLRKPSPRPPPQQARVSVMPIVVGIIHFVYAAWFLGTGVMLMAMASKIDSPAATDGAMVLFGIIAALSFLLLTSGVGLVTYKAWAKYSLLILIVLMLYTCFAGGMKIANGKAAPVDYFVEGMYGFLLILDFFALSKLPEAIQARAILAAVVAREAREARQARPAPPDEAPPAGGA